MLLQSRGRQVYPAGDHVQNMIIGDAQVYPLLHLDDRRSRIHPRSTIDLPHSHAGTNDYWWGGVDIVIAMHLLHSANCFTYLAMLHKALTLQGNQVNQLCLSLMHHLARNALVLTKPITNVPTARVPSVP